MMPHDWMGFNGIEQMWYVCNNCHGLVLGKRNATPDVLITVHDDNLRDYEGKWYTCEEMQVLYIQVE